MTLLSCWILITLLNFDSFLSRNSTGRGYVDGSEFNVELWPWFKIPHWIVTRFKIPRLIMTPGQNSTLNSDSNPRSKFHVESWFGVTFQRGIKTRGYNSTWNHDRWSNFNVESWPGSQFNVESCPGLHFNVELWPRVKIQRGIITQDQNSTWNYDPGSNSTLNNDSGSEFHTELWSQSQVII